MKFRTAVTVVLGLSALPGCTQSPQASAIDNNAAMLQDRLEAQADNMEALADNTTDPNAAAAIDLVADDLQDAKSNVADAAAATKSHLRK